MRKVKPGRTQTKIYLSNLCYRVLATVSVSLGPFLGLVLRNHTVPIQSDLKLNPQTTLKTQIVKYKEGQRHLKKYGCDTVATMSWGEKKD